MIACVLISNFAVAVHRRDSPVLTQGVLIIHASGKVYAASEQAYQAGVKVDIPTTEAQMLISGVHLVQADVEQYRSVFRQLVDALTAFTTLLEPESTLWPVEKSRKRKTVLGLASPRDGVVYLNLERLRLADTAQLIDTIILGIQKKMGLVASIGVASGKFPAYVAATSIAPGQTRLIPSGQEAAFLAEMPIGILPLDAKTSFLLEALKIQTLGQFAALPATGVSTHFGETGKILHQLAMGRDRRPVIPYKKSATLHASRQFDFALEDRLVVEAKLKALTETIATALHKDGRMGRSLALTLSLDNGGEYRQEVALRRPTWNARHLLDTLKDMLEPKYLRSGIRAIEIRLSDFVAAVGEQLELFRITGKQDTKLRQAFPGLLARYGPNFFYSITPLEPMCLLPGPTLEYTPLESL